MAFWRLSTMDSWNPFTLTFWGWGNLFGQTRVELFEILKSKKLSEVMLQTEFTHPKNSNFLMLCPLTNEPIIEPVISIEGVVYEKSAFERRIAAYNDVPGSRLSLTSSDVCSFNALIAALQYATCIRDNYLIKEKALLKASEVAVVSHEKTLHYHKTFTCPLSKKLIDIPVITPQGRVYDLESIKGYLESTGKQYDPIDGTSLCLDSLEPFPEFATNLALYRNPVADTKVKAVHLIDKSVKALETGMDFVGSFFSRPLISNQDGQLVPKPGMDYSLRQ